MVANESGDPASDGGKYYGHALAYLRALLGTKTAWMRLDGLTLHIYLYEREDGERYREFFGGGEVRGPLRGREGGYEEYVYEVLPGALRGG